MIVASRSITNTHRYTAFGLTVNSTFPIPELAGSNSSTTRADITISIGKIPEVLPQAVAVKHHAWTLGNQVWLNFANVGRFWINQGKDIILDKNHPADDIEVRFYLLGAALACALVQRNILPLHGCGIVSGEKAFLFLGESGSGKSTLAAKFQELGYSVLSDDICAVSTRNGSPPHLLVAYPQMKLGPTTLDYLGISYDTLLNFHNHRCKCFLPLLQSGLASSYPIERIYFLKQSSRSFIKDIPKTDCLRQLLLNTHRKAIVQSMCGVQKHFQQCIDILNYTSTFCFARPFDFEQLHSGVIKLKDHLSKTI